MTWPSRVFLSGQAVSLLGDGLAVLAIPLLVLELTRSPLISGLSAASTTLGYLVVGLPAGVLVDRLDAWRVLVTMDAARTAAFAALYLLWVTGAATLWVIMAIALAAGAALLADALTFAASLASLLAVRRRVPHPQRRGAGSVRVLIADFRAGIGYLLSVRVLVIMTVVQIIVNLCLGTEKLMFYYAKVTLGLGAAGVGAVVAVTAAAGWGAGLRRAGPPGRPS